MREDRWKRNMERLELKRRMLNEQFEMQRRRLNEEFDRKQAELNRRLNGRQEDIITMALELLDEDGLTSLSLRKLATKLDIQAPALYWYFKNKDMLIDYLAEAILHEEFSDLAGKQDDQTWQDWFEDVMSRLRKTMLRHQDGARVVAGAHLYPAVTLGKIFELSIKTLIDAGFDLVLARQITMTTTTYTFGYVIEEQASPSKEEFKDHYEEIQKLYPLTADAIHAAQSANPSDDNTLDFLAGLRLILRGAER